MSDWNGEYATVFKNNPDDCVAKLTLSMQEGGKVQVFKEGEEEPLKPGFLVRLNSEGGEELYRQGTTYQRDQFGNISSKSDNTVSPPDVTLSSILSLVANALAVVPSCALTIVSVSVALAVTLTISRLLDVSSNVAKKY